ncbi:unnamed protein product [Linum trigynum]|uniref:Uncharacterized protein n=1 Tax=Linum trigynum TaxID=586398 RepID=A0AAV2FWL4_9ROSI
MQTMMDSPEEIRSPLNTLRLRSFSVVTPREPSAIPLFSLSLSRVFRSHALFPRFKLQPLFSGFRRHPHPRYDPVLRRRRRIARRSDRHFAADQLPPPPSGADGGCHRGSRVVQGRGADKRRTTAAAEDAQELLISVENGGSCSFAAWIVWRVNFQGFSSADGHFPK